MPEYVPAATIVQADCPGKALMVPGEHCVAAMAPVVFTNEPAGAGVQADCPWPEKVPKVQSMETVWPTPGTNEPAGEGRHADWPVLGW